MNGCVARTGRRSTAPTAAPKTSTTRSSRVISRERAIEIARAEVEEQGVMSLKGRSTVAEKDGDVLHVYFPFTDTTIRGGEPHVFVSLADGAVTDVRYTQ